jgi:uncharacterized tellurite resistance protein B-like protein
MGSLAYAIAKADGIIQEEEKKVIKKLAQQEFELSDADNEWITKMFSQLEKDNISLEDSYAYAMDTLEANRHDYDFTDSVKQKCLNFMEKISLSFDGISREEQDILERFKKDLQKF